MKNDKIMRLAEKGQYFKYMSYDHIRAVLFMKNSKEFKQTCDSYDEVPTCIRVMFHRWRAAKISSFRVFASGNVCFTVGLHTKKTFNSIDISKTLFLCSDNEAKKIRKTISSQKVSKEEKYEYDKNYWPFA